MERIEANITIGEHFIQIVGRENAECEVRIAGLLTADQLSGVSLITEVMRCLKNGKPIDLHFVDIHRQANDQDQLVRCEWLESGKLVVREERTHKRFRHADTVEQALDRNRVFTCTRKLLAYIPFHRPKVSTVKKKEPLHVHSEESQQAAG